MPVPVCSNDCNPEAIVGDAFLPVSPDSFYDGKRFLHNLMGDYLVQRLGVCKINGALHIYDNGVYRPGEEILHGHMLKTLPELSDAKRREVYKYIKVNLETPSREISSPRYIPFKSRVYDIDTKSFHDYSPEFVFLNRFPYDYDPNTPEQPRITETITAIADNSDDIINLILEAVGNCFYLLNAYRGAMFLYGPSGNNGKSTLLNMIIQLVGHENASYLSLQDTAEKFRLVEMYGKAINVGDDIPNTFFPDSATFKKAVTGEAVMAEKKGQDPFPFKPFAKMFFALNGLPPISDKSKAFFSRILLVPLNRDFSKSGKDVSLKDRKWTQQEMEYLARLAVEGLHRLIEQDDFTRPQEVKQALAEYERENNPLLDFLEDYGSVEGKPIAFVYSNFKLWSESAGHRNVVTRTRFTQEVLRQRPGYKSESIRHEYFGGSTGRCFVKDW